MGYESEKSWVRVVMRRVDDYKVLKNERVRSMLGFPKENVMEGIGEIFFGKRLML